MNKLYVLLIVVALAGCSLAPDYTRPALPTPATYPDGAGAGQQKLLPDTRQFFRDPQLQRLIEIGLASNRDLRVATLNIEQARALYRIQRAERLPSLDANGSLSRQRGNIDSAVAGGSKVSSLYSVGIGLSAYVLDLFDRVRNLTDAQLNEYMAVSETQRAVALSLVAEIATAYLNQRALSERIEITRMTLKSRDEELVLIRHRLAHGVGSDLDLSQAETQLESARSDLAPILNGPACWSYAAVLEPSQWPAHVKQRRAADSPRPWRTGRRMP